MLKKTDINKQLKIFVTTLFILFALLFISILLTYSNISNNFISSNGNIDESSLAGQYVFKYLSIFLFVSLILLSIFLMLIMRNIYRRIVLFNKEADPASDKDRAITDLILNMYHELKTPISVILGAVKLMESKELEVLQGRQSMQKNLKIIKNNSYRLLRLINNVLDISRINSGVVHINLKNYNIVGLAEEITQSVSPYAEVKGIKLNFQSEDEEIVTAVDEDKFERILLNLLSNAIKFSGPNGSVTVYVRTFRDRVLISVKDTGPGIPRDMQKAIFERFRQVGSSRTSHEEGSGLGLSIVKSYVELHGGKIHLESELGKGSEFIIELPLRLVPDDPAGRTAMDDYNVRDSVNVELSDIR